MNEVNLKKGLAFLMLALLSIPSISMFAYSDTPPVDTEDDCELASEILTLVETSRDKAEAVIRSLEEEGTEIPEEAERAFEKGNEFLEEALEMMNETDCRPASEKLTEALQHYGKAAQEALEAEGEPEDEEHEEAEKAVGLGEAIERAYMFLEKVNETATDFEEKGIDVTEVRNMLLEANQTLTQAERELGDGNLTGAVELKSSARETIGQAMGLLHSMNRGNKAERTVEFLEKTEGRLQKLQGKLNEILGNLDLPPEAIEGINGALMNAQDKIQVVKDLLETGDLDNALDELDGVLEASDEALDAVDEHDHGIGSKLRSMEKIQAKLDFLNETVQTLKDEGEDVPTLETLLMTAKDKLNEASDILTSSELGEEQINGVEALIDEAEEHVEEVDDQLDDLKEEIEEHGEEEEARGEHEEEAGELREELDALLEELKSLNETAIGLASEGVNVTDIMDLLEEAEAILEDVDLEEAEEALESWMDSAGELIDEAEGLIGVLIEAGEETDEEPVIASERIEELEELLSSFEEEIEELRGKQVNVEQLTGQIERLRAIIEEAKASENPEELLEQAEELLEGIEGLLVTLG